jgi:hypothetical protein
MGNSEMIDWLESKRDDLKRWEKVGNLLGTPDIKTWDAYRFFKVIDEQAREIRRLKTQLNRWSK